MHPKTKNNRTAKTQRTQRDFHQGGAIYFFVFSFVGRISGIVSWWLEQSFTF
jgi:hypothetical protein